MKDDMMTGNGERLSFDRVAHLTNRLALGLCCGMVVSRNFDLAVGMLFAVSIVYGVAWLFFTLRNRSSLEGGEIAPRRST